MVLDINKAQHLSSNHAAKLVHYHHYQQQYHHQFKVPQLINLNLVLVGTVKLCAVVPMCKISQSAEFSDDVIKFSNNQSLQVLVGPIFRYSRKI